MLQVQGAATSRGRWQTEHPAAQGSAVPACSRWSRRDVRRLRRSPAGLPEHRSSRRAGRRSPTAPACRGPGCPRGRGRPRPRGSGARRPCPGAGCRCTRGSSRRRALGPRVRQRLSLRTSKCSTMLTLDLELPRTRPRAPAGGSSATRASRSGSEEGCRVGGHVGPAVQSELTLIRGGESASAGSPHGARRARSRTASTLERVPRRRPRRPTGLRARATEHHRRRPTRAAGEGTGCRRARRRRRRSSRNQSAA